MRNTNTNQWRCKTSRFLTAAMLGMIALCSVGGLRAQAQSNDLPGAKKFTFDCKKNQFTLFGLNNGAGIIIYDPTNSGACDLLLACFDKNAKQVGLAATIKKGDKAPFFGCGGDAVSMEVQALEDAKGKGELTYTIPGTDQLEQNGP